MATELGSKAVEIGEGQTASAEESILVLASSVSDSAQAATQIAAAGQQQLIGMEQVAASMENIKQASLQSVASVNQVEAAANDLRDLGQKLKALVAVYKV